MISKILSKYKAPSYFSPYILHTELASALLFVVTKNIILLLGFLCLILFSVLWYTNNKLDKISYDYYYIKSQYEVQKQLYESEKIKTDDIINKLNSNIDKYKIDLQSYTDTIKKKEKELEEIRLNKQSMINDELSKDSSNDNQLKIINRLLYEFSNKTN